MSLSKSATVAEWKFPKASDFPAKPVVRYSKQLMLMDVGYNAIVVPIDHPNHDLNGEVVTTSRVVSIDANGKDFETRNTKYVYDDQGE
jgi:hypothetical protein